MKKSLTFVISSLSLGGAERVVSVMANYWTGKGWKITLLTLDNGKERPFFDLHPSILLRPLDLKSAPSNPVRGIMRNIRRILVLRKAIKESRPQYLISFMDQTNILAILAAAGLGLPVIVSERTDPYQHKIGRFWEILRIWVYPHAYCVIVQTRGAVTYFPPQIRQCIKVIPNPAIFPETKGEDSSWNHKKGKKGKKGKVIIAMGRFVKEKGFDLLLKAFSRISDRYPEWSLTVLGDGPLRPDLELLRDKLGLGNQVSFPGMIKNPATALKESDIFVLSSRYEGFPNALCEAMACGLPVVSFDCPNGPGEIIRDGIDGILVQPEDIDALAGAMERLIKNGQDRARLGQRALEIVDRFGIERVMKQWEDVLKGAGAFSCPPGGKGFPPY